MSPSRLFEGVAIALDSIRANKVRAFLTILGVAVGVMVVIAIASAITGINRGVQEQIETLGPKTFFVQKYFQGGLDINDGSEESQPWRRYPALTVAEAELIRRLPSVQNVTWRESTGGPISNGDKRLSGVEVIGFSPAWILSVGGTILAGRNFTDVEEAGNAYVVVINTKAAEELFPGLDPVGRRMKIFGVPFEVVGLYQQAEGLFGGGGSPIVVIPHSTFTKVAEYDKGWLMFAVRPTETASVQQTMDEVTAALRIHRGLKPSQENNFALVTQDKLLETFNNVTRIFFMVMIALSSVGLMVGGVGVVAIMMISVTERTREIGVRKALGATRREIMLQFLVEAATLTLVGCLIGMALGGLIAFGIRRLTPLQAAVPMGAVLAAVLASTVTGVLFGLYPANKAARMDPVEALRYE
jgi:putative ABC transport system permease protein